MILRMAADIISYLRAICQYKIHADSIEAKRAQTVFDGLGFPDLGGALYEAHQELSIFTPNSGPSSGLHSSEWTIRFNRFGLTSQRAVASFASSTSYAASMGWALSSRVQDGPEGVAGENLDPGR